MEEQLELIPIEVTIRKHGTSLGINLRKDIVEQLDLHEGENVLILISKSVPASPLEKDFIRWQREKIKKEILRKYNERFKKNKELFEQWYKERVEQVDFFSFETIEETVEIPSEENFSPPQVFLISLKENEISHLPYDIAVKLEREGIGKIVRKPIEQDKWLEDFKEWLKEKKRFENFLKLYPNLRKEYREAVRKGELITYDEFVKKKYEDWKTKKIDF